MISPMVSPQQPTVSTQQSQATRIGSIVTSTTVARERILLLLASLFTATGLVLLALVDTQSAAANVISHISPRLNVLDLALAFMMWTVCFGVIHVFLNRYHRERDP